MTLAQRPWQLKTMQAFLPKLYLGCFAIGTGEDGHQPDTLGAYISHSQGFLYQRWDEFTPRYKELRPDPGTYGLDDGLMTSSLGNKGRKFGSSILSASCMPGKKSRLVLHYYPRGTRWKQSTHARKVSRLFLHIGMIQ